MKITTAAASPGKTSNLGRWHEGCSPHALHLPGCPWQLMAERFRVGAKNGGILDPDPPSSPGHALPHQQGKGHFKGLLRRKWTRGKKKKREGKSTEKSSDRKEQGLKGRQARQGAGEWTAQWQGAGEWAARCKGSTAAAQHWCCLLVLVASLGMTCQHEHAWFLQTCLVSGGCRCDFPATRPGRFPLRVPRARREGPWGRQELGGGWVSLPPPRMRRRWAGWERSRVRGLLGLEITLSIFHFLIDKGCPAQKRNLERHARAAWDAESHNARSYNAGTGWLLGWVCTKWTQPWGTHGARWAPAQLRRRG